MKRRLLPVLLAPLATLTLMALPKPAHASSALLEWLAGFTGPYAPLIQEGVGVTLSSSSSYVNGITFNCQKIGGGYSNSHYYWINHGWGDAQGKFDYTDPQPFTQLSSGTYLLWAVATGKTMTGPPPAPETDWNASTGGGAGDQQTFP